jgi:calcineurin-like phosphoesterase family protein
MSETWFIGDTHFGHANILKYEKAARPFDSIEQMNEAIIDRWNAVVGEFDKVFHLGDFCFGSHNIEIAKRLKGQKRLILGNHDVYNADQYLKYFNTVHGVLFWNDCILTHVPVHPKQLEHRAKYNIHGHLHSNQLDDEKYINVSCENNNLTPINADEIWEKDE